MFKSYTEINSKGDTEGISQKLCIILKDSCFTKDKTNKKIHFNSHNVFKRIELLRNKGEIFFYV